MTAAELTYFTCTGWFYDIESPDTSGVTNADQFLGLTGGYITFTPRVPTGFTVLVADLDLGSGNTGSTSISLAPITGRVMGTIVNGLPVWELCTINASDTPGIQMLSNSAPVAASLNAQGITQLIYDVSFTKVTFAAADQTIQNFAFVAPTDTTPVCITDPTFTKLKYGESAPAFTLPAGVTPFGASLLAASTQADAAALLEVPTVPSVGIVKSTGTVLTDATAGTDYVAPGGALGSPSSGTLTNCTGLPVAGGGTGVATLTGIAVGNGTSAMTAATGANIVAPSSGHGLSTRETPTGSVNGSNASFTLAHTPVSGTEVLTYNGVTQTAGGVDYSISGATITFVAAPLSGQLLCTYWF